MSATGRSDVRHMLDHYETPAWAVEAILPHFLAEAYPAHGRILDPGCGSGAIGQVLHDRAPNCRILGVELDDDKAEAALKRPGAYDKVVVGNFLEVKNRLDVSATIGNPPFSQAQAFIDHAREYFEGPVCFLLRLAFLESKKRALWWGANPADVYVLPERPSFAWTFGCTEDRKNHRRSMPVGTEGPIYCHACGAPMKKSSTTDNAAMAWFIWHGNGPGRVRVLPC